MDEEKLDPELKQVLIDRIEAWDLVDFLQLSITDIVEAFEERIVENLSDVLENYQIEGVEGESED